MASFDKALKKVRIGQGKTGVRHLFSGSLTTEVVLEGRCVSIVGRVETPQDEEGIEWT